jgi:hypothetical protein
MLRGVNILSNAGGEEIAVVVRIMTDQPITLDDRRGMAAQMATEIRRLLAEVEANELCLRARQEELEKQLIAAPAATWFEAAERRPTSSVSLPPRRSHRIPDERC